MNKKWKLCIYIDDGWKLGDWMVWSSLADGWPK